VNAWVTLLIGVAIGLLIGFRAGTLWFPVLMGRIETWAIRGRVGQYKRRRRR
jgi:hypothetical protein